MSSRQSSRIHNASNVKSNTNNGIIDAQFSTVNKKSEEELEIARRKLKKEKKWWIGKSVVFEVANDEDRIYMRENVEALGAVSLFFVCFLF